MDNIISLAAVRAERRKQALSLHARNGETVAIETRTGLITAEKITCRERFAEILNNFGDYFVIDYADIRALRPVSPVVHTSVVNARGDFVSLHNTVTPAAPVAILPFARRARRK